ncbi:MAG: hypothetical protein JXQ90_21715 [Cyclobacteriaceae bacterium]
MSMSQFTIKRLIKMCTPSNHIKLCTCNDVSTETGSYWQLRERKKNITIYGEVLPPRLSSYDANRIDIILEALNSGKAFDMDLNLDSYHALKIVLQDGDKQCTYHFTYYPGADWQYNRGGAGLAGLEKEPKMKGVIKTDISISNDTSESFKAL